MSKVDDSSHWQGEGDPSTGTAVLSGEIDFTNSLAVRDWLRKFCKGYTDSVILDLAAVDYIDSSGLAILIEIRKQLKKEKRTIYISAVSDQGRKLFSLTQVGDLFGI